jgi:glycosyltransferase involved in cell wall biosynthesis
MKISKSRWNITPADRKKIEGNKMYIWIDTESKWKEVDEIGAVETSPIYGNLTVNVPWEGSCVKKPWEYKITTAIPCLNTSETLPICIELLRLQTIKPFIMIIDTGSISEHLEKILALRAEDVEVHTLALNGVRHPSDYPAMAMDTAFAVNRSPYLFATHADCFLRRRDFLEYMLNLCMEKSPAVGYELSPRQHHDWKGMLSHTASMYDMKVMDDIDFAWSLRRLCNRYGVVDYHPDPLGSNWPDTEILGNYILKRHDIKPFLIGSEENQSRTLDGNIDHFRSYTSGKMYSPDYFRKVEAWYKDAHKEAVERIREWKESSLGVE